MLAEYDERMQIVEERSYMVAKANEMIQKARYDLNIHELKLMSFIFSKIKPTDTQLQIYYFTIKEYCQVCGIDPKNGGNYVYVRNALQKLRDKSFWVTQEDGHEETVGWIGKVHAYPHSGKIGVELDPLMHKYVIGLIEKKLYTQYELLSTLPMQSSYSFRIYEMLKSILQKYNSKSETYDIDNLKKQLTATHYVNFKDFRRFVLETATKEINLYTDIEVSWEPIYKGRKVIQVTFHVKKRDMWSRYAAAQRATEQLDGQMSIYDYPEVVPNEK